MTIIKTTKIGINDFIELWDNVKSGKFSEIFNDIDEKIEKIWRKSILSRFSVRKSKDYMTYGTLTEEDVKVAVKMIDSKTSDVEPAIPTRNYKDNWYRTAYQVDKEGNVKTKRVLNNRARDLYYANHPFKYKKDGELENKMRSMAYYESVLGNTLEVTVTIPIKTDYELNPTPETYQILERYRSFVGSSLTLALPEIIGVIINEIK